MAKQYLRLASGSFISFDENMGIQRSLDIYRAVIPLCDQPWKN